MCIAGFVRVRQGLTNHNTVKKNKSQVINKSTWQFDKQCELVFYAIFQLFLVTYGGQFPELEGQIVPGSGPATFRKQLTTTYHGIRTPAERGE